MPGHDMTRFYALIPILTVLFVLNPLAFAAVANALGIVTALKQLD